VPEFRSGFASIVGRPNAGKSTLVNQLVGTKITITSDRPQTTRTTVRGVRDTPTSQLVLLDTPGLHRPRTTLGERTNHRARAALADVDVIALVMDASTPIGPGDRYVADLVHDVATPCVLVVNKTDVATDDGVVTHLADADQLGEFDAYVPCSALTGDHVDVVAAELEARLPPGPRYYPEGTVTDQPETWSDSSSPSASNATPRRASSSAGAARPSRPRSPPPATSSRRSSAPASTSRPGSESTATGNAAPTPSTGSASDPLRPLPGPLRPQGFRGP
jgi:small GTP-binding protein